jgi:hypothetical protein
VNGTERPEGLAQARRWTHPLPAQSPTTPILRANPFPEVTDLICRLPLPTFFYRPEAANLGDLMRYGYDLVRIRRHSAGFSRSHSSSADAAKLPHFRQCQNPFSLQSDSRASAAYAEKKTLPGPSVGVPSFACVATTDMKIHGSLPGSGILTRFPFGCVRAFHKRVNCPTIATRISPSLRID